MKKLVAYFSASGVTAARARELAEVAGADLFEIVPAQRYTSADLDWTNRKSRSSVEMNDAGSRPAMAGSADVSGYDRVYIGFPVWWGVAPHIVDTFIESADLSGKEIVIFATSGGSGISQAVRDLKTRYPKLNITGGRLLNGPVVVDIA